MARSSLVVGAHLRVYVNGQPFGRTIDGEFEIATPRRWTRGLDFLLPIEAVPTGITVTGSLRVYRQHGDGGAEAAGIVAPAADATLEKYFSLLILDRVTDTVLFRADRCALDRQRWSLPTKGYVTGTFSFGAVTSTNETASKLPSGS